MAELKSLSMYLKCHKWIIHYYYIKLANLQQLIQHFELNYIYFS